MAYTKSCETCGREFAGRSQSARYCRRSCYPSRVTRTERNRRSYAVVECFWCGRQCKREANRKHLPACSARCRVAVSMYKSSRVQSAWPRMVKCRTCSTKVATIPGRRRNVRCARCKPIREVLALTCCECGDRFDHSQYGSLAHPLYCSQRCKWRVAERVRRARVRNANRAAVRRWEIFERDALQCYLCGDHMDAELRVPHPKAPTLDHIVPLSRGGTHEPSNIATACFQCNVYKGSLVIA